MSLRRRLALFLDPTLVERHELPIRLGGWQNDRHIERIADALENINRKTLTKRPRIIECAHPELHPEDDPFDRTGLAG